jgi:gluconokinase
MSRVDTEVTHQNTNIVVMGVAGSGKTTVAALLAGRLGASFAEGDEFHPPENVAKMSQGIPLDDADRWPWLATIRDWLSSEHDAGRSAVVPASSLRRAYRDLLREAHGGVLFVHLTGSRALLTERIQGRAGHFMKPEMLESQLATLEPLGEDEAGLVVDVTPRPAQIVDAVIELLAERGVRPAGAARATGSAPATHAAPGAVAPRPAEER